MSNSPLPPPLSQIQKSLVQTFFSIFFSFLLLNVFFFNSYNFGAQKPRSLAPNGIAHAPLRLNIK